MRSFFEELRYRNVFRVAIAYTVIGWLIAQVADLVFDAFELPNTFMQLIIIVLLLGFPLAVFLAWAFELTPDGVKKAADVTAEDHPKDPRVGRGLNTLIIATLIIAVSWLGFDKIRGPSEGAAPTAFDRSIAVLPFDDFSPDGDHAWFADGLAEEILNSLARTPDLQVSSRTSSFKYRGSDLDISAIGTELGVAHILEGSVRRAGNHLRVTAQLIRTTDDTHLWSETFDGNIENSIEIQDDIAVAIARALQTAMDPEELALMLSAGTRSVEAWELYLRGIALQNQAFDQLSSDDLLIAAEFYRAAVVSDPDFVDAHLELMDFWWYQMDPSTTAFNEGGPSFTERRRRFDSAAEASLRLARSDMERLSVEFRRAQVGLQVKEQVRIAEQMALLVPTESDAWGSLMDLYQLTGQQEKAFAAAMTFWTLPRGPDDLRPAALFQMRRIDIDQAVQMVEGALAGADTSQLPTIFFYQAQRVYLDAGMLEKATSMIDHYMLRSTDNVGKGMIQIRQACAEGRVADADAIFATLDPETSSRWLLLKTLGLDVEARETLRVLDTPDMLFVLANYLDYRTFEARDYPLLWRTLQAQGIDRPPARPQTFQCKR